MRRRRRRLDDGRLIAVERESVHAASSLFLWFWWFWPPTQADNLPLNNSAFYCGSKKTASRARTREEINGAKRSGRFDTQLEPENRFAAARNLSTPEAFPLG
jgi:hypothetical protein